MEFLSDLFRAESAHHHIASRKIDLTSAVAASVVRAGARGLYFDIVDLVTQLDEETRIGYARS